LKAFPRLIFFGVLSSFFSFRDLWENPDTPLNCLKYQYPLFQLRHFCRIEHVTIFSPATTGEDNPYDALPLSRDMSMRQASGVLAIGVGVNGSTPFG
jgi:hypothetical protein